jgi:hypothetical protein
VLPFETYSLKLNGSSINIRGWIFCETKTHASPDHQRFSGDETLSHRVRFYITDQSRVVLECIKKPIACEYIHYVSEYETLEDAVNGLAVLPINFVNQRLYDFVMDDLMKRAHLGGSER